MKIHRLTILALAALAAAFLAGCDSSGSADLNKSDEETLRNNMTRQLTPEEIARLGGGASDAKQGDAPADAAKPPAKEGQ